MDRNLLERKALPELREIASTMDLRGYQRLKKAELIDLIMGGNGATASAAASNGAPEAYVTRDTEMRGDGRDEMRSDEDAPRPSDEGDGETTGSHGSEGNGEVRSHDSMRDDDTDQADQAHERDGFERSRERTRSRMGTSQGGGPQGQPGAGFQSQAGARGSRNKRNRQRKGRDERGPMVPEDVGELETRTGVLDLLPEGYGFMRCSGYLAGPKDVYVSQSLVRRHGLRRGDLIAGPIRSNKQGNDKFPALVRIDMLEGEQVPDGMVPRRDFKDLTPYFPRERLRLETPTSPVAMRIVDMIAPVGKGQRGLIVSPPKAGKTTILKQLANAIETNNPEVVLMVLLVDERPEEVTDFERSTQGQVVASTFDRPADDHTQVAELVSERAKRLVERGHDVVILLDSITRLARAYNLAAPASGRILSGGVDSAALYPPKRFFGAARNIEEGGSLTIIATALVETGSKMDEVIFEEFKGTGNMELRLDRKLEQKRIFPAVDIEASGTRKEELLLAPDELDAVWKLRRVLASLEGGASLELLIDKLRQTKSNEQFLQLIQKSNLS